MKIGISFFNFIVNLRGQNQNQNKTKQNKNIKHLIPHHPLLIGSFSNFKLEHKGTNQKQRCLKWNTTYNGRKSQDIKKIWKLEYIWFELKLRGPNQNHYYMKWKQPQMEDDLIVSR